MQRYAAWAIVACAMLVGEAVRAEPGEGEKKAAAQALFDEARTLSASGKHVEACPKLAESLRLDPSMGTRFYLAECFEQIGKLASAWTYYLEVADGAKAAGQKDREKFAADRAEALRPRLPKLAVKVSDGARAIAGLEIKRNGIMVGDAQWGVAIPIDLGKHAVAATAPGRKPWAAEVIVKQEGEALEVIVPALEDAAPPPPPPPPVHVEKPAPPPPPKPPARVASQRVGGFIVGGVGVGGLGVSFALGALALGKKSASNDPSGGCDATTNVCNAAGLALRSDGLAFATGSTVLFFTSLAAIGTGVALVVTSPSSARAAAIPSVAVGPTGASATWSF